MTDRRARLSLALPLLLPVLLPVAAAHDGHGAAHPAAAGLTAEPVELEVLAHPTGPVLVPHVVAAARELVPVHGQLFVHNPADVAAAPLELLELRLLLEGVVVETRPLANRLHGDARFTALLEALERLPREVTELHRDRYVAAPDAPEVPITAVPGTVQAMTALLNELRGAWALGAPEPFLALDVTYELDQLFEAEAAPGAQRRVAFELDWREPGGPRTTTVVEVQVTRLGPKPGLSPTLARARDAAGEPLLASLPQVHAGDLHVHSCHGEASGACAPSGNCGAESLQLTGSFTYAQLKSQYQALGIDWFTATDHSYCIDSPGEYGVIAAECAALTDGAFLVFPDTELSSDEEGPQQGSDLGDLICLGGTQSNHMGAHGISSWKQGGQEAFWGFCDGPFTDELQGFSANVDKIRAEGGWPIANHPAGSSFTWNSVASLRGIENDDLHGIEVWNGGGVSGQGGNVGMWVDWLRDGRILYAYSGSDTHDEAFDFGANHVVLEPGVPFSQATVELALREGRSYISSGPSLVHEAVLGGDRIGMGSLQTLSPAQQGLSLVQAEAHYDLGGATGTVTLFGGVEGVGESVIASSAGLTGAGVLTGSFPLAPGKHVWTRAYVEGAGGVAYSNPIFYLPGTGASTAYGTGLGGANVGSLASASAPAIGATVELDLAGLAGAATAVLAMSPTDLPGGLPVAGGFLLVSLPTSFQTGVPLDTAGAGSFSFRMPYAPGLVGGQLYWQAVAPTALQPAGLAFTNGLAMPITGLGQ